MARDEDSEGYIVQEVEGVHLASDTQSSKSKVLLVQYVDQNGNLVSMGDGGGLIPSTQLPAGLGQALMAASLPVVIASDQSKIPTKIGALDFSVNLTVTNGAYTIGYVVGGLITITNAVSENGKSMIIDSVALSGQTAAIAYELWLLNADLATPNVADNAALALVAADVSKLLGVIPIPTANQYQAQNAIFCASVAVGKKVKAAAGTTSIYAYLKATAVTSPGVTAMTLNVNGHWVD